MLSRLALGATFASRTAFSVPRTSVQTQIVRGFRGRSDPTRRIINVKPVQGVSQGLKSKVGPLEVGQLFACGGAAFGLGSLCYYGLGLANEPGAVDRAVAWPQFVKDRIRDTYFYFGASAAAVAGSAVAVFRSPAGQKLFFLCERHPIMSTVGLLAALIGSSQAMMTVPYTPGFGSKQALWLVNCGVLGLAIAPIGVFGGAIAVRAAMYTAGIVGGLSAVAACAPSDRYLKWAGPLGIGLGGVFVASLGSMFVPATSTLGLGLMSVSLYGGLVLFSAFLLYDTQKIIRKAETHPQPANWQVSQYSGQQNWGVAPFDPINASHHIVMDAVNIFMRIAQILVMGGGGRRK